MGALTRNYDWSTTALGTPDQWPLSLRTTVGIVLHSAFPLFLFWGPDLICFYNDAYRGSLGDEGKHPAVGKRGADVWPEIWNFIGPLIDRVLQTGEPTFFADQLVPIYRNGRLEDVYWTFSYSPAYGDGGEINGVLVVCNETTQALMGRRRLEADEARFRSIIQQTPAATMVLHGDNYVIDQINDSMMAQMGQGETVIGKPLLTVMPELEGEFAWQQVQNTYRNGVSFDGREVPVTHATAGVLQKHWYNLAYRPLWEDDNIVGMIQVVTDVTEQVLVRQKIEESEARFRSLIDESPVATALFVGPELIIAVANESMIRFFGKGPSIVGKPIREVLAVPGDDSSAIALLDQVFATGNPFWATAAPAELTIDGVPGTYYFDLSLKPLRDAAGVVYAILETATDVTEQVLARQKLEESEIRYRTLSVRLEEQVHERTEELAAANEELAATNEELRVINQELLESNHLLARSNDNLQKFAYVASHDLQEPLRKIQQFGDLLRTQYANSLGEGVGYLERMQSAASRMSTLIRDLLNFSRISTRREANVPVPLDDVVSAVLADLDLAIAESKALVDVRPLPIVAGDAMQLRQLVQNLLSNALKFRRAYVPPVITVSSRFLMASDLPPAVRPIHNTVAYHCIDVADNGIGFDDKYADRIFEVFQRLHGRSEFGGTGIGLAIVQKVVENHGGAIKVTSQPGQGATFSVYLPQIGVGAAGSISSLR
ncbi:PAS domain-containing sensor histidine kinase [Spirosoma arcticum]